MTKKELAQWTHNELGKIESIITDKKTHKDFINKEKLKSFLLEFYNTFNPVKDKWCQGRANTYANILEKIQKGDFDNE